MNNRQEHGLKLDLKIDKVGRAVDLGDISFAWGKVSVAKGNQAWGDNTEFGCSIEFIGGCSCGASFKNKKDLLKYLDQLEKATGKICELLCETRKIDDEIEPLQIKREGLVKKMFEYVEQEEDK